jgi:hypothetical protein
MPVRALTKWLLQQGCQERTALWLDLTDDAQRDRLGSNVVGHLMAREEDTGMGAALSGLATRREGEKSKNESQF